MRTLTLTDFLSALPEQPVPVLLLVHTEAPDPPQRRVALLSGSFVIGRDVSVGKGLSLPLDRWASRHHTELLISAGIVRIRDLGSKNGTFLNGTRVQAETMKGGDVLRVGNSLLVLRYEPAQVLDAPASEHEIHEKLRGESLAIRALRHSLWRAARDEAPVLLLGETGTGKELAARVLHVLSPRAAAPRICVNSSAITAELADSLLFGHLERSFTGARRQQGFFGAANGGVLFLDEVGELPLLLQPKLLRALEAGEICPVGASSPEPCNVRIVAATNRDLLHAVEQGSFRRDLYHRLAAHTIELPPLRQRREDIPLLFAHFLGGRCRITSRLAEALLLAEWPGNVRQLQQLARLGLSRAERESVLDLPALQNDLHLRTTRSAQAAAGAAPAPSRRRPDYTRETMERLLRENEGVIARIAQKLGRSRRQIVRVLDGLGLCPTSYRSRRPAERAVAMQE